MTMFSLNKKRLLLAALPTLFLGCASLSGKDSKPLSAEMLHGLKDMDPMTCEYQKTWLQNQKTSQAAWYFMRQPNRTETRDLATDQGDIWQRDDQGRLFKIRLFNQDRVALEYTDGDLKASDRLASWPTIWSIVDTRQFGKDLKLAAKETFYGVELETYQGKLDGVDVKMEWLPSLKLPKSISRHGPGMDEDLDLVSCKSLSTASIKPMTTAKLNDYRHIDFTDLGDMEQDPAVQKIMRLSGEHSHDHGDHHE